MAADIAEIFRAPKLEVAQDVRSLPPRASAVQSAPRFTLVMVLVGWVLVGMAGVKAGKAYWQQAAMRKEAKALQTKIDALQDRVKGEKATSDADLDAQRFMNAQEQLLTEVRSAAEFTTALFLAKPAAVPLVGLSIRKPAQPAESEQWDVTMRFRNDDKGSGSMVRDSMLEALKKAQFTIKIQNRPTPDDQESVMLYALIKAPSSQP